MPVVLKGCTTGCHCVDKANTVTFRLQPLGLYNFVRGFRSAYKQWAYNRLKKHFKTSYIAVLIKKALYLSVNVFSIKAGLEVNFLVHLQSFARKIYFH